MAAFALYGANVCFTDPPEFNPGKSMKSIKSMIVKKKIWGKSGYLWVNRVRSINHVVTSMPRVLIFI
jgi:hypothetical protein